VTTGAFPGAASSIDGYGVPLSRKRSLDRANNAGIACQGECFLLMQMGILPFIYSKMTGFSVVQ